MSRTAERQVSFADWELMRQGLRLEPLLQAISDFLDDQKDMIEQVRCDLTRGLKKAETGRGGLTRSRSCARWFSCASRTGSIANCAGGLPMDAHCASSRTSIVCRCLRHDAFH